MILIVINAIAIIFLSVLVFIAEKIETTIKILLVVFCLLVTFGSDYFFGVVQLKKAREVARAKACSANQRVLMGAVEMYNMDHPTMMKELDIKILLKPYKGFTYLKEAPIKPESDCIYISEGDLSGMGIIKCKRHGTVKDIANKYR